ncbi:hypothetical protein ACOME3_000427 [Neoechinorhynchus agilis]
MHTFTALILASLIELICSSNMVLIAYPSNGNNRMFSLNSHIYINKDDQIQWTMRSNNRCRTSQSIEIQVCQTVKERKCHKLLITSDRFKFLSQIACQLSFVRNIIDIYIDCVYIGSLTLPRNYLRVGDRPTVLIDSYYQMNDVSIEIVVQPLLRQTTFSPLQLQTYRFLLRLEKRINDMSSNKTFTGNQSKSLNEQINITTDEVSKQTTPLYTTIRDNLTWTVIHNRGPAFRPPRSAANNWVSYKEGFGSNVTNEYWMGLEKMNGLIGNTPVQLRLEAWKDGKEGDKWIEVIDGFSVGKESEGYPLRIAAENSTSETYRGPIYKAFLYHNNSMFSTADNDNDDWKDGNCAVTAGGGWWYKECAKILPTGHYYTLWITDDKIGKIHYFDYVQMLIR